MAIEVVLYVERVAAGCPNAISQPIRMAILRQRREDLFCALQEESAEGVELPTSLPAELRE